MPVVPTIHSKIKMAMKHLEALQLQSEESQSDFKISYRYEGDESHKLIDQINEILQWESLTYSCLVGFSPQSNREMVDLLPKGVDKAYALEWLSDLHGWTSNRIFYAGDSGNDLAALIKDYASVLVGNAKDRLRSEIKALLSEQKSDRSCYFAESPATSGVLEGMKHFRMV